MRKQATTAFIRTSDEGPAVGLIHVHVWNFTLRREPYLKSSFEGSGVYSPGLREALLRNDLMPDTVKSQDESRFINRYGLNATDLGFWSNASYAACDASAPPSLGAVESARATHQPGLFLYNDTADPESSCTSDDFYQAMIRWAQVWHKAVNSQSCDAGNCAALS